jgi:hypothetical protein
MGTGSGLGGSSTTPKLSEAYTYEAKSPEDPHDRSNIDCNYQLLQQRWHTCLFNTNLSSQTISRCCIYSRQILKKAQFPTKEPTIECELVHVHIDGAHQYEALSYVWGDPKKGSTTIRIQAGGRSPLAAALSVTNSLFIALQQLRFTSEKRHLWIDQIYTNQNDIPEKNIQVRRMGEIYSKARSPVVWLGPQNDEDAGLLREEFGVACWRQRISIASTEGDDGGEGD